VQALSLTASVFREAQDRGYTKMNLVDIGGGFPGAVRFQRPTASRAGQGDQHRARPPLSRKNIQILAEPGRFMWRPPASRFKVIGRRCVTQDLPTTSTTASPHLFRHPSSTTANIRSKRLKKGPTSLCSVFGPTCDALDVVSMAENLPRAGTRRLRYQENNRRLQPRLPPTYFNGLPRPRRWFMFGCAETLISGCAGKWSGDSGPLPTVGPPLAGGPLGCMSLLVRAGTAGLQAIDARVESFTT